MMQFQTGRKRAQSAREQGSPATIIGSLVKATCRKCKATTPHLVLTKVGVKPSSVECSVCKGTHEYRLKAAPRGAVEQHRAERGWADAMKDATSPPTVYSTSHSYKVGGRVSHPTFGEGLVTRLVSSTICEVLFEERSVRLVMQPGSKFSSFEPGESQPRARRGRRFG